MSTAIKFRGGTTAQHSTFVGAAREVTVDTTKNALVVHDGTTAGGWPVARTADIGATIQAYDAFTAKLNEAQSWTAKQTMSGAAIDEAQGANIASAATINLTTATGNYVHVTGTTAITAITLAQGAERTVVFDGALTLTNGASLVLPTGANITTAAGDIAKFRGEAAGVVRCVSYTKADGTAISSSGAPIQGVVKNLQASATGTGANISVSCDEIAVENSSNSYQTLRNLSLTINSAASGANGLDTGSLVTNTWYALWVIWNGTTAAGLISLSSSAPTMPGGYTHKARVGWIRTDGTANKYPLGFKQFGKSVRYALAAASNVASYPLMASGTNIASWTAIGVSNFVPPTAAKINVVVFVGGNGTNSGVVSVSPNNVPTNAYNNPSVMSVIIGNYASPSIIGDLVLESTNIYWQAASTVNTSSVSAYGWEDNL